MRTPASFRDDHILNGEVKVKGDGRLVAQGFHHQAPGTDGNARLVRGTVTRPDEFGVYEAAVEIRDPRTGRWVRKATASTFFPKEWSRSQVRSAIVEAYSRRPDPDAREWVARLPSGMHVFVAVDPSNRITTAYPLRHKE